MMVEKRLLMKDRASMRDISWAKKFRTFVRTRDRRIECGKNVVIMPRVDIRMTDNAKLILGNYCVIDSYAYLQLTKPEPKIILGDYVTIGRGTVLAAKKLIKIGKYSMLGPHCQINDQSHEFAKGELIMNQPAIIKEVVIGQDCWFGSGVRVVMGVTIGDGAVIGAGSVVTKDIPPYQIWAGNPARFIRERV
jgi:acetyltransferase-like isoleucine patch superfamily enzyme